MKRIQLKKTLNIETQEKTETSSIVEPHEYFIEGNKLGSKKVKTKPKKESRIFTRNQRQSKTDGSPKHSGQKLLFMLTFDNKEKL